MTKDEIKAIVAEMHDGMDADDYLVELVNRAVAIEREACAKLVDYWEARQGEHSDAIRARGEK